jgi:NAD(P)-dependent dehydrogenase (short-subunit alcohol dehydrogenase family)
MAVELARLGIRINAVLPGPIEGRRMNSFADQTGVAAAQTGVAAARQAFEAAIPLRRFGTPEEVAAVVACCPTTRPS